MEDFFFQVAVEGELRPFLELNPKLLFLLVWLINETTKISPIYFFGYLIVGSTAIAWKIFFFQVAVEEGLRPFLELNPKLLFLLDWLTNETTKISPIYFFGYLVVGSTAIAWKIFFFLAVEGG